MGKALERRVSALSPWEAPNYNPLYPGVTRGSLIHFKSLQDERGSRLHMLLKLRFPREIWAQWSCLQQPPTQGGGPSRDVAFDCPAQQRQLLTRQPTRGARRPREAPLGASSLCMSHAGCNDEMQTAWETDNPRCPDPAGGTLGGSDPITRPVAAFPPFWYARTPGGVALGSSGRSCS